MSLDAFWTQLHTRMKDETRRLAEKKKHLENNLEVLQVDDCCN